jgi:DNA mismatch repair protein MutS
MASDPKLTPMMIQYRSAKAELDEDVLLLFRMGDFYELFFEDAVRGSKLMDITLTKRAGVPMAGVPHHALEGYVAKLVEAGVKIAIAEQMEDPKQAKGIVKREITQIITPGTVVEGASLDSGRSNFIVAICRGKNDAFGIACLDISTGDFRLTELTDAAQLEMEINRLQPAECLVPERLYETWGAEGFPEIGRAVAWTPLDDWTFDAAVAIDVLQRHFEVASLDGFGCREFPIGTQAAGAVLYYAQNNLRRDASHITVLSPYSSSSFMVVDRISQRNLELVEPLFTDARNATLLALLNETVTPMGSRLMREWILRPLLDIAAIVERQDAVEVFVRDQLLLVELREALGAVRDVERTITRLNVGAANGRDLRVLQRGVAAIPDLRAILDTTTDAALLNRIAQRLCGQPQLVDLIDRAVVEEPPLTIKEGGVIKEGYNDHLDDLRKGATEGKQWLAELQAREQQATGIRNLKIRFNKVFGYYIEISKSNLDLVPDSYVRKQTLTNAERFTTAELKEIEDKVLGAEEKAKALEFEIFQELRAAAVAETAIVQALARAVAELDVLGGLAQVALQNHYTRPQVNDGMTIDIRDGRHPVIDHLMKAEPFVPNDIHLDDMSNQMIILTGPNMAGKSTYIRQVALLVLLAQMGSFIPAGAATIGQVDRIFTRVGAADDLSRGQSTFMVEMLETANILNNATNRSLIILDEIGRGTSTFDGLSIAWAVAEFIHNTAALQARTLFATHYHELTELSLTMRGVQNYNVAVKEQGDSITFLRKILPGASDKSYGIHVARLAGLPRSVIERANEILSNLEGNEFDETNQPKLAKSPRRKREEAADQPSLFQ